MNDSKASAAKSGLEPESKSDDPPRGLWDGVRSRLRRALRPNQDASLKEALEEVIEEHEEHTAEELAPEEKVMLHNVLSFSDLHVSDIMIPRTDICAVPANIELKALKEHIATLRHTRIPVYEETLDHVKGFIHVKDLLPMLAGDAEFDLQRIMRTLLFVPPSMRIIDLLLRMRHAGSHMAMVVDEYGGTDGLITMEDLFEEIVGDIQDEHDNDEEADERIQRVGEHAYDVNARIHLDRLEKRLGLTLLPEEKEGEFETLGGLIFYQLGRVPARNEIVLHDSGARFEIIDADARRIHKVRIHL